MKLIDQDAGHVADLIIAGRLEEAQELYSWYCEHFSRKFWECLALQDKVRVKAGVFWPASKPL